MNLDEHFSHWVLPFFLLFAVQHKFQYVLIVFPFIFKYFLISLVLPSLIHWLGVCCLISRNLWIFQLSSFYWFLISTRYAWRRYFVWYLAFKIYWYLICGLTYSLSPGMSHMHLRRMCTLLLGKMFCVCWLDVVDLLCYSSPLFSDLSGCFIYCWE